MEKETKASDDDAENSNIMKYEGYPVELEDDLKGIDLSHAFIAEVLTTAWEYTRCVVPHFTNRRRYLALIRTVAIGTVAEFRGDLVDVAAGNNILGYDLNELMNAVFGGTPMHADMAREFRTFLLLTAEKTSQNRDSDLFRRYVNALAASPGDWFRLRDCDGLVRYFIAGAMACNDVDHVWFGEDELQLLGELAVTSYDAVSFHKHRAEGETHNTFAYAGPEMRRLCFRQSREVLWRLDAAWALKAPELRCVLNFIRYFSGPIHVMMHRYRFVEDDLTIGNPETESVIRQTRRHFKLWNRVDVIERQQKQPPTAREASITAQSDRLMFPGLAEMLRRGNHGHCDHCQYRISYGSESVGRFGGVVLCDACREEWRAYIETLPARAVKTFRNLDAWQTVTLSRCGRDTASRRRCRGVVLVFVFTFWSVVFLAAMLWCPQTSLGFRGILGWFGRLDDDSV